MVPRAPHISLQRLLLYHFKNYEEAELHFGNSAVICFLGKNGSGKTNLLDAIHYLSFTKSFFNAADSQNIADGHEQGSIIGEFEKAGMPEYIQIALRKNHRKILKRNFKEYDRLSEHIGLLPSVMVTPYDIELVWEGSEERRRFMDTTISQHSRSYLECLMQYNHALHQRNHLLKTFALRGGYSASMLEPWDFQLAEKGEQLFEERKKFLEQFIPLFTDVYSAICEGKEIPHISYQSDLHEKPLAQWLKENAERDRVIERTGNGPHKDDLDFTLNTFSLKKYASQGQQKSFLFALKLAQHKWLATSGSISPLLMLDDLFDKVDEHRVQQIMIWLKENNTGQVFITDTHLERLPQMLQSMNINFEAWQVHDGKVLKENLVLS